MKIAWSLQISNKAMRLAKQIWIDISLNNAK